MTPAGLLLNVHGRLTAYSQAKALYAERLAPDFSVFEFLDTREKGLSRILAWLLDPLGNHAQGDRFLRAFVRWLGVDPAWADGLSFARVATEVPTTTGASPGFIDILVSWADRAIAIENKPTAPDQPRQVERYLDDLRAKCPGGHSLLYLSGDGDGPSEHSVDAGRAERELFAGTLRVNGYLELVRWLEECSTLCRAPSVTTVIDGMTSYIRKEFGGMGDVEQTADLANTICRSPEMLEAALAVLEADAPIKRLIIERLVAQVRQELTGRPGWQVIRDDIGYDKHSGLLIGFAADASIGFGLQFDYAKYGYLFYGIASEDGRPLPARVKPLLQALIGSEAETRHWPAWKRVGPNDRHFPLSQQVDRNFWLATQDGRLAGMLVRFAAEVERALEKSALLEAVRGRTMIRN